MYTLYPSNRGCQNIFHRLAMALDIERACHDKDQGILFYSTFLRYAAHNFQQLELT